MCWARQVCCHCCVAVCRGLPLRPAEPECSFYVRNGWCSFSDTCKFHHPELPDRHTAETWGSPTAAAGSDQRQEGVRPAADLSLQERGQKVHHSRPRTNVKPQQGPTYVAHPHMLQPMSPYGLAPPGMMMPYGYYHPAMSPHARMFPPVTAAMTYPMYHMRPYMSMPMAGPPVQLAQQMQQMTIYNPSSSSRSGSSSRHRPQQGYSSSSGRGGRSGHLRGGGVGDSSGARRRTAAAAAADDDEEGVSAAVDTTTARDTS